ncbi:MAG: chemotaxis response regulator protein-glutamate methylesterase [Nitrospirota bacterium]|nr:chemotaxis response regulator protein-glutamate methylesterase [Nitrospirota bacterium]
MIKVLVVDDSSFMRKSLAHILETDPSITVVDTADNGEEAVIKAERLRPDVVLLDLSMPVMDGLAALAQIMASRPTPVLVLSGLAKKDATVAFRALEHGAVDYIAKPSGVISYDIERLRSEIILKVRNAAAADVGKLLRWMPALLPAPARTARDGGGSIVVLGASTGGVNALPLVLSGLPRDMKSALLVVQHMSLEFIPHLAERLKRACALPVAIARKDAVVVPGQVLVAPGGCHTVIARHEGTVKIRFTRKNAASHLSPSVDLAMESAAAVYGERTVGVLLTGMGADGARGMCAVKDAGGATIAQDESSCVVFGMPKAAIEAGCVDQVLPLPKIADAILSKAS